MRSVTNVSVDFVCLILKRLALTWINLGYQGAQCYLSTFKEIVSQLR